jgi:hypothetical protein
MSDLARTPGAALVVLSVLSVLAVSAVGAADERPEVGAVSPADIDHGETAQTIRLGGEVPAGETTLTVDVTPLAGAGVALSNASAAVARSPGDLASDATVERIGDRTVIRTTLNASEPTSFRLALRLEGLETADAETDRLRYDGTLGNRSFQSNLFQLEPPGLPDLRADVESDRLTAGRADASQRLRVAIVDTPPGTPVTVAVDLRALEHAGVSVGDLRADAAVVDGDLTVERLTVAGSTVEMGVVAGSTDGGAVALDLSGVDTRMADPADGLRYRLTVDAPAGAKTVTSNPFGIYAAGEAPTPTETVVESPTETRTGTVTAGPDAGSSPGGSSGPTGFTILATGAALALVIGALALRGRE